MGVKLICAKLEWVQSVVVASGLTFHCIRLLSLVYYLLSWNIWTLFLLRKHISTLDWWNAMSFWCLGNQWIFMKPWNVPIFICCFFVTICDCLQVLSCCNFCIPLFMWLLWNKNSVATLLVSNCCTLIRFTVARNISDCRHHWLCTDIRHFCM